MTQDIKVNQICDTLYDGQILQPYFYVFISTIAFAIFQVVVFENIVATTRRVYIAIFQPASQPLKETQGPRNNMDDIVVSDGVLSLNDITVKNNECSDIEETDKKDAEVQKSDINASKNTNIELFFQFNALLAIVEFLYFVATLDYSKSGWTNYTNMVGYVTNSAFTSLWYIALSDLEYFAKYGFVLFICSLPMLLTHIIPGILIYAWVYIGFLIAVIVFILVFFLALFCAIIVAAILFGILHSIFFCIFSCAILDESLSQAALDAFYGKVLETLDTIKSTFDKPLGNLAKIVFLSIIRRFFVVLLLQTTVNYAALYYQNPGSSTHYIFVLVREYLLRTQTECYLKHGMSSVKGGISVFSWL